MTIPATEILATFTTAKDGRCRWRCALCPEVGVADEKSATNDYERHYAANHRDKETE